jgi:hypothetical protein
MNEKEPPSFTGVLSMDRLFVGSKSEGIYPVLHANTGQKFRLHYKGELSLSEKTLSSYNGKNVQVVGNVDKLRGHWRIVLSSGSLPVEVEASHPAQDIDQQETSHQSRSDASEQPSGSIGKKSS